MNRRAALKNIVGTTISVAVVLQFVPNTYYITDDTVELDRLTWWRENFTIQKVEHAKDTLGTDLVQVMVSQNGRPDRVVCVTVALSGTATFNDVIENTKDAIAQHAKRKGWVKIQPS